MDADQGLPPVLAGIEGVGQWRRESEAETHRKHVEIERERARLESDILELKRQIEVLGQLRTEADDRLARLPVEESRRNREALVAGLGAESALLEQRSRSFAEAGKGREEQVNRLLEDPETSRLVDEFEQFREVEPTLDTLPAGYRAAILNHHETVRKRLQPVFEAVAADLPSTDDTPAAFTVVAAVEPPEGPPQALAIILPVPHEVASRWAERPEDLSAMVAWRVVSAIGGALADVGAADAPLQHGEYEGRLAIQAWLGDSAVRGDLKDAVAARFDALREEAAELRTTQLDLYLVWVGPDVVAPAVDDEEEADDASA